MRHIKAFLATGLVALAIGSATAQAPKSPETKTAARLGTVVSPQAAAATATVTYRYDSLGRLIQDAYPANTLSYSYDAAGNRTQANTQ